MGTTTKITFEEFQNLPEQEGKHYELDEGELLVEPSPALRHNLIRQRIVLKMMPFVESNRLGAVAEEMDFRLAADTVRNPDVALITAEHLQNVDQDRSPVVGAPALAIEIVSPSNTAQDMAKKTQQYLSAGSRVVWIIHPAIRMVEIHSAAGVRKVREPEPLKEESLLPGFSLSLQYVFDGK
jgi:Uma2 family endonuclease